jgi:ABC-2 type transport system permease protein
LLAKVVPLFILLLGDVLLALTIGKVIFNVPFRCNFFLFMALASLYIFVSIGVGIMLATLCQIPTAGSFNHLFYQFTHGTIIRSDRTD